MKKLILTASMCCAYFFISISLYAQNIIVQFPPGYNVIVENERIPGVEGSQYLSEEWTNSRITLNNGSIIDSIDLRLNAYRSAMHYRVNGIEYAIGSPENIKEVMMGSKKFIYSAFKDKESISHNYFEVITEGKTSLLVLYYIVKTPSNYNVQLNVGNKNDQLELKEKYYLKIDDSIIAHDKKGKNLLLSVGDKSDLISKKIKEEKLSFKKKEDLIKIITYINALK